MKRVHLLRVERDPGSFDLLFAAARELGLRLGWLEWHPGAPLSESSGPADPGPTKTVRIDGRRVVATKDLRGPPVLVDFLREHFRGCAAVLVRGELPTEAGGWLVEPSAGEYLVRGVGELGGSPSYERLGAEALARRLRRPRPFGDR